MTTAISTRKYENAHGRKPRGRGHWMFELGYDAFAASGTFTEACKAARAHARRIGYAGTIEVLS